MIEFPDVTYHFSIDNWGSVESWTDNSITLSKESFVPGLWAGIKDQYFGVRSSGGGIYKMVINVLSVDLENRILYTSPIFIAEGFEPNDVLYLMTEELHGN